MNDPLEAPEVAPAPQPQPVGVGSLQDTPDTITGDVAAWVVERAREALDELERAKARDWDFGEGINGANIAANALAVLVPDLIAEVERLRAREDVVAQASYRTGVLDAMEGVVDE